MSLGFEEALGSVTPHYHFEPGRIPYALVNILPQPRKTFPEEEIVSLGINIFLEGQINPLTIAKFLSHEDAETYLHTINEIWERDFKIADFVKVVENGKPIFYFLLAGERRFRSIGWLFSLGWPALKQKLLEQEFDFMESLEKDELGERLALYEERYSEMSRDGKIDVSLGINIPPWRALYIQASENTYVPPPKHEEAEFYARFWKVVKKADPRYPLTLFAKRVNRSPETIRNAVTFTNLPVEIQTLVAKGEIAYGMALELARLFQNGTVGKELEWWTLRARLGNYKVPDFRELVTQYLYEKKAGQTLLQLFSREQQREFEKQKIRMIVQPQVVQALWTWIGYVQKVLKLFRSGQLGSNDSPFSERSPIRIYGTLIQVEEEVLPHLWNLLPKRKRKKALQIIQESKVLIESLEQHLEQKTV